MDGGQIIKYEPTRVDLVEGGRWKLCILFAIHAFKIIIRLEHHKELSGSRVWDSKEGRLERM